MEKLTEIQLLRMAYEARKKAYVPYSNHGVGAAIESADGVIFTGCNIENAAYGPTNCAERTAIFKAVSEGVRDFTRIAIVGGMMDAKQLDLCAPCGVCRQVMREFCDPDSFEIILGKMSKDEVVEVKSFYLKELLPLSFGPDNLK